MRDSAAPAGHAPRSVSRRDVLRYAFAPTILGLAAAMAEGPTAAAAGLTLIDFAEKRIAPDEIKAAGYGGVVN